MIRPRVTAIEAPSLRDSALPAYAVRIIGLPRVTINVCSY